jgi:hypothetical protein
MSETTAPNRQQGRSKPLNSRAYIRPDIVMHALIDGFGELEHAPNILASNCISASRDVTMIPLGIVFPEGSTL